MTSGYCTDEVRREYVFAKCYRFSPYFIANDELTDLCFYIWLYISILDGYTDFTRKKYIKSEKSAVVYGFVQKPLPADNLIK